jgi:hypothetical protein
MGGRSPIDASWVNQAKDWQILGINRLKTTISYLYCCFIGSGNVVSKVILGY